MTDVLEESIEKHVASEQEALALRKALQQKQFELSVIRDREARATNTESRLLAIQLKAEIEQLAEQLQSAMQRMEHHRTTIERAR